MLHASRLEVSLSRRPILRGVEFRARSGQLTAIVGPNGSGKTTLLRALTGETPFTGRVELDGEDITALKPWQLAARRAVLPQATRLAFPFTVLEVVRLGLASGREAGRESLAEAALERVGLSGFEGRLFHELSGGEQQRAQLARVLVQVWHPVVDDQPCWLFLDEPVASLDIGQQLEVMRLAREFASGGGGVVAVMHDLNLTAMFADSVAVMRGGHLMQQGPPGEVLTDGCLSQAYGCRVRVNVTPAPGAPFLLPHACVASARLEQVASAS